MISQAVQDTIKRAIETGDMRSLYDYFADDVELRIAIAVGSSVSDERSKPSAIDCLRKLAEADMSLPDEAPEFFVNGERLVAYWDESVSLRSGVAIRDQCTLVFDVHDGLITRLAIHHDLSPAHTSTSERQVGREPKAAVSVASKAQRDRAVRPRPAQN